jgi:hypothetical protein
MAQKLKKSYWRLPGRGPLITSLFSRCFLYRGDDHLLAIDNHGFSEDYKRFYFADIQSIITRQTRRGTIWNIVLALIIAGALSGAILPQSVGLRVFFWIFCGFFLILLLINILRGPTCICHIITAVQADRLPSLNRLRTARKVIRLLRLSIEKVQGTLSAEELAKPLNQAITSASIAARSARDRQKELKHYGGAAHLIAFVLLLAAGIFTTITLLHHTPIVTLIADALSALSFIVLIIALAKQHETDIPGSVRAITWTSLAFVSISAFLSYILLVTAVMRNPQVLMMTQWDMYQAMLALSPQDYPVLLAIYGFTAVCSLALSAIGLFRVVKHRTTMQTIPSSSLQGV